MNSLLDILKFPFRLIFKLIGKTFVSLLRRGNLFGRLQKLTGQIHFAQVETQRATLTEHPSTCPSSTASTCSVIAIQNNRWVRVEGDYIIPFDPNRSAQLMSAAPGLMQLRRLQISMFPDVFDRICFYKVSDIVTVSTLIQAWSMQDGKLFLVDVDDYTTEMSKWVSATYRLPSPERMPTLSDWFKGCKELQTKSPYRMRRSLLITEYDTVDRLRLLMTELSLSRLHSHSVLYIPTIWRLPPSRQCLQFDALIGRWANEHSIIFAELDLERGIWCGKQPNDIDVPVRISNSTAIYEAPVRNLTSSGIKMNCYP